MERADQNLRVSNQDRYLLKKHHWYLHKSSGYYCTKYKGKQIFLHRLIAGVDGLEVDHINRIKTDNRRSNLRAVSKHVNHVNRGLQANNTTGAKGVFFYKKLNKYCAAIARPRIYLGVYADIKDAAYVYNTIAKFIYGSYAVLNRR
jgi:hypothetical protein